MRWCSWELLTKKKTSERKESNSIRGASESGAAYERRSFQREGKRIIVWKVVKKGTAREAQSWQ